MIDPLKNQIDDTFFGFDFSIQKLIYSAQSMMFSSPLMQSAAVPEPGAAALLITAIAAFLPRRTRSMKRRN